MSSSSMDRDDPRHRRRNPKTDSEEEQARVLQASLRHVMKFGWSEEAMTAGAKEIGVSPSIVGYFPRKAAALVQAHPLNVPASFKQRAMLVDEIWHTTTDEDSDIDWYVKCTVLGGIYSTTEVYMLTDHSPEFCDTQLFLDDQVKDAFGFKKTIRRNCWYRNGEFIASICRQSVTEMKKS